MGIAGTIPATMNVQLKEWNDTSRIVAFFFQRGQSLRCGGSDSSREPSGKVDLLLGVVVLSKWTAEQSGLLLSAMMNERNSRADG